jgi:hypothetical protein
MTVRGDGGGVCSLSVVGAPRSAASCTELLGHWLLTHYSLL